MEIIGKAIEWMGDHKFITFLGAAGVGGLVVSKVASAATPPALPGTTNVAKLPSGGLQQGNVIVKPPAAHDTGNAFFITTKDPAPYGNLNARANGQTDANGNPLGAIVGYWPKDGPVELLDPGSGNGMVFVGGPGIDQNGNAVKLEAWAANAYLQKRDPLTAMDPTGSLASIAAAFGGRAA